MVMPEGFKFPDVQALTQAEASRVIDELHTFADAPRAAHGATVDAAVAALGAGGDTVIASMHAGAYQAAAFIREEASAQEADLDDQCFCAGVSFGLGMMLRWLDAAPPAGPSALSGRAFELGEAWSERMRERTGVCDG